MFLGCSDSDFHIPKERVELTGQVLGRMDAQVDLRLYPRMGHLVNEDEIRQVQQLMDAVLTG